MDSRGTAPNTTAPLSYSAPVGAGTLGAAPVDIPPGADVLFDSGSASNRTVSCQPRSGGGAVTRPLNALGMLIIRGSDFSQFTGSAADSGIYVSFGAAGSFDGITAVRTGSVIATQSGVWKVFVNGTTTKVSSKYMAPANIGAASAEATVSAGVGTVAVGTRVTFNLSFSGPLTTPADTLAYIAIKGHTSGNYYASVGPGGALSGYFDMVETGEALDIVARNQDTVAHTIAASYVGTSP